MNRARRHKAHARRRRRKAFARVLEGVKADVRRVLRRELGVQDPNRILGITVHRIEDGIAHCTASIRPIGYERAIVVEAVFR